VAQTPFSFTDFNEQLEYLTERGIDEITVKRLGLEVKTSTWLHEQGFPKVPGLSRGIVWRLRDPEGVATGKLGARVFYQQGIVPNTDKPKFLPPKGQVPGLYFSPLSPSDKLEYNDKVYICESYLKADICAMLGFHAIGVSGCWGWSYTNKLNWDFKLLPWHDLRLQPIVCMDSNVCEANPKLWLAARKLSASMEVEYQVHASILVLPPPKEGQWGLDDYYAKMGRDATQDYLHGEPEPLPSAMSDHLKIMAQEVCWCDQLAMCIRISDGLLMSRGNFESGHYADRQVWNEDGKPVPVAKTYMKWPERTVVNDYVYLPGQPRLITEGRGSYNAWEGMGCEPLAADVSLFTDWLELVFTEQEREYILDWWAWQLQNLGGKLTTGLVMVGPPGIGKGWVTAIFTRIFGNKNVASVPLTVLEKNFNAEVATRQLFVVEETDEVGGNNQLVYNKLKDMITNPILRLEKKGVDAIFIDNRLNVFLTGNQVGIFKLDANDRRFYVAECVEPDGIIAVANSQSFWEHRWEWMDAGGAEAIYGYLLSRDLAHFNPKGMAPMTGAKKDMIELTHTTLDLWVQQLISDPEAVLVAGHSEVDGCVATAKELLWLYKEGHVRLCDLDRGEVNGMNRALKNARVELANGGNKIKVAGYPARYFIIRPTPPSVLSWAALVTDRVFWQRLVASEQGNGSQTEPTGYPESSKKY